MAPNKVIDRTWRTAAIYLHTTLIETPHFRNNHSVALYQIQFTRRRGTATKPSPPSLRSLQSLAMCVIQQLVNSFNLNMIRSVYWRTQSSDSRLVNVSRVLQLELSRARALEVLEPASAMP